MVDPTRENLDWLCFRLNETVETDKTNETDFFISNTVNLLAPQEKGEIPKIGKKCVISEQFPILELMTLASHPQGQKSSFPSADGLCGVRKIPDNRNLCGGAPHPARCARHPLPQS